MKSSDYLTWIGSVFGTICTALQTDEVLRYIQLGLTILSTLFAIAFTIYKWWKKASEDGKITKEEIEDLTDDISDVLNDKEKGDKE